MKGYVTDMKKILREGYFTGERALFHSDGVKIVDSVFADGESPLKESTDIEVEGSIFKWKYPLWYSKDVTVRDSTLLVTARSGIWYTDNVTLEGCTVDAPKTFRRCDGVRVFGCTMPNAAETLWNCKNITVENTSVSGDYFAMGSSDIKLTGFSLSGNYAFDGARNIEISDSKLISKDAFWNCENVTVRNCLIIGEYLGWNSKNVRFIDCTIESNQGLCYMDGVVLENCKLINTDLAFEFSSVDADVTTRVVSVKNPVSGKIRARAIDELIMEADMIDPAKTEIITEE